MQHQGQILTLVVSVQASDPVLQPQCLSIRFKAELQLQRVRQRCPLCKQCLQMLKRKSGRADNLPQCALRVGPQRQYPGTAPARQLRLNPLFRRLGFQPRADQLGAQLILIQPIETERLMLQRYFVQRIKPDVEALVEKGMCRVAQKALQWLETDAGWQLRRRQFTALPLIEVFMHFTPFARIGKQTWMPLEIARTERLQRVLGRQGIQQPFAVLPRYNPALLEVIAQLSHQYRWGLLHIVAYAAPYPADIECIPCRQQCFQKQIAVVLSS